MTPDEYRRAFATLERELAPTDRAAKWGMWALLLGVLAAIILWAPVVLADGAMMAVMGGILLVCVVAMGGEAITMMTRARFAKRHHPNPMIRAFARRVWWGRRG